VVGGSGGAVMVRILLSGRQKKLYKRYDRQTAALFSASTLFHDDGSDL